MMRVLADALQLPLRTASVDMIISNPPYPGNGVWTGYYGQALETVLVECRRVLRRGRHGFFLLRQGRHERWLSFSRTSQRWEHPGRSVLTDTFLPGIQWGAIPEADLVPLILEQTEAGDVVLDPFAGRGGIPKLAARLGRIPVGVDIDADQLKNGGPYA